MRIKRIAVVSVVTFLLGGVCGGAYAYVAHQNGQEDLSLADGLGQVQENVAVAQFVSEESGWYQIITSDGLQGYVSAEYVDVTAN